jgi:hypothetical protein
LPVRYFHVVFTLPGAIADIAYQNKAVVYDLLLKAAAGTTIAADPKHLGARIGLTAVLHTWGSALTHHPHAHIIVPGGGFSPDRRHWIACRPGFFLSVRVLSRLFRRLFLERLTAAYQAGRLEFFADQAALAEPAAFKTHLAAVRKVECSSRLRLAGVRKPLTIPAVRCAPTERVKSIHLSRSLPRDQVRLYDPGSAVQVHNSGRVPSRHKQGSEFRRWARRQPPASAPPVGYFSPVRGCGLPGQNRVTPGGGAE